MWSSQVVFFFACKSGHHAFSSSAGKDLPLSEENNDISILSVRESASGLADSLARLTRPHGAFLNSEEEDALLEEGGQSEFDPTERIFSEETNLESDELLYEDLFKDTEDCGPKVNKGVAKRVNSACTKRPAKE